MGGEGRGPSRLYRWTSVEEARRGLQAPLRARRPFDFACRGTDTMAEQGASPSAKKKLYIETVGCQMNLLDSEMVVAKLRQEGYELTEDIQQADAILYNTCSVRQHAEDKIYSALGRLRGHKRRHPESRKDSL